MNGRTEGRSFTADDEEFWVQQRHHVRDREAEFAPCIVDDVERGGVTHLNEHQELLARDVVILCAH